jgi:glutamate synthase (NADPH/NADH) large chain
MSGGIAYVYDPDDTFARRLNLEMVDLDPLEDEDREWLRAAIRTHCAETASPVAQRLLDRWHGEVRRFKKVMPKDYKRVLEAARGAEERGLDVDEAIMAVARG